MKDLDKKMLNFCTIQLQILKEREENLRKEILDCKLQNEFLTTIIHDLTNPQRPTPDEK